MLTLEKDCMVEGIFKDLLNPADMPTVAGEVTVALGQAKVTEHKKT